MYSRNFVIDNTSSENKLKPGISQSRSTASAGAIPVKSFTDNFAYERFNRLGTNKDYTKKIEPPEQVSEKNDNNDITVSIEKDDVNESQAVCENKSKPAEVHVDDKNILGRIKKVFDADTILIILALVITLFADNETNDKLTPLALLAILFIN